MKAHASRRTDMHDRPSAAVGPCHRAARARWRMCFLAYAIVLVTATHWPALELGTEEVPAADKALHLYAFAILTAFLWMTEWIRSVMVVMVAGLIWITADELTQSLPFLDRHFSTLDVISSALGVGVACASIAALRPRGGEPNRVRLANARAIQHALLGARLRGATPMAWLLLGALLAQVGLGLVVALPIILVGLPSLAPAIVYGLIQAILIGVCIAAFDRLARWKGMGFLSSRACPSCEQENACTTFDAAGRGRCAGCGRAMHRGTWLPAPSPDSLQLRRFIQGPAALAICILGAGVALFYLAIALYTRAVHSGESGSVALRAARLVHDLPDDFILSIDLSLLLLALAAMVWMYRGKLARWHDRQHLECRRCGYDLHATPIERGVGACPECGASFASFQSPAPAG